MVSAKEFIKHKDSEKEAWVCICGNTPDSNGFYPCDNQGNETIPAEGWEGLYVCAQCERIIEQNTLDVVDQNANFKRLD